MQKIDRNLVNEEYLIKKINDNLTSAENILNGGQSGYAGTMRTSLESAVILFYLKKYGQIPTWTMGNFVLYDAINDYRFTSCFNNTILSDISLIRTKCNHGIHPSGREFSEAEARELLPLLKKCIIIIARTINIEIINDNLAMTANAVHEVSNIVDHPSIIDNFNKEEPLSNEITEKKKAIAMRMLTQKTVALRLASIVLEFIAEEHPEIEIGKLIDIAKDEYTKRYLETGKSVKK